MAKQSSYLDMVSFDGRCARENPRVLSGLESSSAMRWSVWMAIFIGSTLGGMVPELWGGDMLSYSGVLLSASALSRGCGSHTGFECSGARKAIVATSTDPKSD